MLIAAAEGPSRRPIPSGYAAIAMIDCEEVLAHSEGVWMLRQKVYLRKISKH
jgi:hypothetical protein